MSSGIVKNGNIYFPICNCIQTVAERTIMVYSYARLPVDKRRKQSVKTSAGGGRWCGAISYPNTLARIDDV